MKVITLEEGLFVYNFSPETKGEFVGYNVLLLQNDNEILIVDTAFRRHFNQIVEDLTHKGLTITKVVTTHFHRDHIGGLVRLKHAESYASIFCTKTLDIVFRGGDYTDYMPKHVVVNKQIINFGKFKVELEINSGHSIDGLLVTINDKYVVTGDDVIFTDEHEALLPFAADGDINAHIKSLIKISNKVSNGVMIPSHGHVISNHDQIQKDISDRIKYFIWKKENMNKDHDDFREETGISFLGHMWYKNNI